MLNILTGRCHRLWPHVLEAAQAAQRNGQRVCILVPAQFTLEAELDLVQYLGTPGLLDVEVLSPKRLFERVLEAAGAPQRTRMTDSGKAMVLSSVLSQIKDALVHYRRAADRPGLSEKLASAIGDFKKAGRTADDLLQLSAQIPDTETGLKIKLADTAKVMHAYEERLLGSFVDDEDVTAAVIDRLQDSGLFRGVTLWVFGFDLIPIQFARLLFALSREAAVTTLTMTLDEVPAPDAAVFSPQRDTLQRTSKLAQEAGIPISRTHVHDQTPINPPLHFLETHLFSHTNTVFGGKADAIRARIAMNPYDEALRTAATIRTLSERGIPLEKIAVWVGDANAYEAAIASAFRLSSIPYHFASPRTAIAHPFAKALVAGLCASCENMRASDALDALKGGFTGLSLEEAQALEAYALAKGLRGAKWQRIIPDSRLEDLRKRFTDPIFALKNALREAKDGKQSVTALFSYLSDVNAYDILQKRAEAFHQEGLFEDAADCAQVWRIVLDTLDQLHDLLGDARLTMREAVRLLTTGLSSATLGGLPLSNGAVSVGVLGHMKRERSTAAVFLLGMNDGLFATSEGGLWSDQEIAQVEQFAGMDAAFGLSGDTLSLVKQMGLLDAISAAGERLFLSYSLSGGKGEVLRPAAWLLPLRKLFPSVELRFDPNEKLPISAPLLAMESMGSWLQDDEVDRIGQDEQGAIAWLLHNPATQKTAEAVLSTLVKKREIPALPAHLVQDLYGRGSLNVSRLTTFANCPYQHFVKNGLKPKEVEIFEVDRRDTGTFYHRALTAFAEKAAQYPHFPLLSQSESNRAMDAALAPLTAEWADGPLQETARSLALAASYVRVARRTGWAFLRQLQKSQFTLRGFELRFGRGEILPPIALELSDGRTVFVEGRIDRMDAWVDEGATFLRVMDYKTSGQKVEASKLDVGLQLQLPLYLAAAIASTEDAVPAGFHYAHFQDPLVKTEDDSEEAIEAALIEKLKETGFVLSEAKVLTALGSSTKAGVASADRKEFFALLAHAKRIAVALYERMEQGEIDMLPVEDKFRSPCTFCDVRTLCTHTFMDPKRPVPKITWETLLEKAMHP